MTETDKPNLHICLSIPSVLFPFGFPPEHHIYSFFLIRATSIAHSILLDLIIPIIFGECNEIAAHYAIYSSLSRPLNCVTIPEPHDSSPFHPPLLHIPNGFLPLGFRIKIPCPIIKLYALPISTHFIRPLQCLKSTTIRNSLS